MLNFFCFQPCDLCSSESSFRDSNLNFKKRFKWNKSETNLKHIALDYNSYSISFCSLRSENVDSNDHTMEMIYVWFESSDSDRIQFLNFIKCWVFQFQLDGVKILDFWVVIVLCLCHTIFDKWKINWFILEYRVIKITRVLFTFPLLTFSYQMTDLQCEKMTLKLDFF